MTNHHSKFDDSRLKCLAAIETILKLKVTMSLTFDLVALKQQGHNYSGHDQPPQNVEDSKRNCLTGIDKRRFYKSRS